VGAAGSVAVRGRHYHLANAQRLCPAQGDLQRGLGVLRATLLKDKSS